jgi:hypothetical protein
LRVRVIGVREFIAAFGSIDYELRTAEDSVTGQITEDGQMIELPLTYAVSKAELVLMRSTVFELAIGGLGPVDAPRGAFDRLETLGYAAEIVSSDSEADDDEEAALDPLAEALLRFQSEHGLSPTGELDAATQRTLTDEYGA